MLHPLITQEKPDSILNNNKICEAVNCIAEATITIDVKVGEGGKIPLSLCSKCVNKFEDSGANTQ